MPPIPCHVPVKGLMLCPWTLSSPPPGGVAEAKWIVRLFKVLLNGLSAISLLPNGSKPTHLFRAISGTRTCRSGFFGPPGRLEA